MNNLQDQLLQAGLVNAKQTKLANKVKKKQAKDIRRGLSFGAESEQRAMLAKQEKAARSKQLNHQREIQKQQKESMAQAKQILAHCRLDLTTGDQIYNFVDDKKVKRVYVTTDQQRWLSKGSLVIVGLDNHYDVVPAAVTEKVAQRTVQANIIKVVSEQQESVGDDPYADDDLMW